MSEKYKNLKVKELQELLQKNGLSHTGKKEELIERLVQHDQQTAELASLEEEFGDLEEFDETKLALDDIDDSLEPVEEKKVEQIKTTTTVAPAPATPADTKVPEMTSTTTSTTLKAEVKTTEEPITKPKSNFKFTPIVFDKKKEEEKKVDEVVVEKKEEKKPKLPVVPPKVTDDAEKALERAKRFGIQLNETAKKDIRAQRFGIPAATTTDKKTTNDTKPTKNSPTVKGIDPEVLKKRAERFGLAKPTTATATATAAPGSKVPVIVDSADEEKKRKRAERFQHEAAKKQKAE